MKNDTTFFFCIGCQKSGTTLLARLLDQHPDAACMNESYWLIPTHGDSLLNLENGRWRRHYGFDDALMAELAATPTPFLSRPWLRRAGRWMRYLDPYSRRHCSRFEGVLRRLGEAWGATVVGDKWPWYIDYIELMCAVFPDARYIYNVRDPRGLWNSAQRFKDRARGDYVLDEMLRMDARVAPYLSRPNFMTFRYEDLAGSPEETMARICGFLGLEHDAAYLAYKPKIDPAPVRWNWVPETRDPVNVHHAEKWRERMTREEILRVSERADAFVEKYGYDKADQIL